MTTHDLIFHEPDRRVRRVGPTTFSMRSPRSAVALGLVVWMLVALAVRPSALSAVALVPAVVAAAHDVRHRIVPDRWVVATGGLAAAGATITAGSDGLAAAGVGAAAVGLPHLVVHLAAPTRLGFGDVKFAAALGVAIGPAGSAIDEQLMLAMLLVSGAACVGLVVAVASRRRDVPDAPSLVIATIAVLLVSARLGAVPA